MLDFFYGLYDAEERVDEADWMQNAEEVQENIR
jgi:hypothetical protein